MPKDDWWSIKQRGCENSTRAHGMSSSVCDHQVKNQGRLRNLDVDQNFGGCCSRYNKKVGTIEGLTWCKYGLCHLGTSSGKYSLWLDTEAIGVGAMARVFIIVNNFCLWSCCPNSRLTCGWGYEPHGLWLGGTWRVGNHSDLHYQISFFV